MRGAAPTPNADLARQRAAVDAFFAPAWEGDFAALVSVLDPGVVLRSDGAAAAVRGAETVAAQAFAFRRLSSFVRSVLVNRAAGVVVAPQGRPFSVMGFTVVVGKIVAIDALADPVRLRRPDQKVRDDRTMG